MQESADYHQPPAPVKHHLPGIARCLVLGVIGKSGVAVRYSTTGSPCASFTLVVREQGQDGKVHELWVPCEVWGKRAEGVTALEAGQLCLFDGKLAKRKKGEQWEFVVSGWDVQVLGAPMAALPVRN
jgi:single-stranded DNA-binding protein